MVSLADIFDRLKKTFVNTQH